MYLKSIEINGFKSFANKIVFDFNDGITAIVGPNGSGKSNVSDAVRWVLGEQSAKQLRGAKMEDVIFAGTQIRKPQSSAYVALTLDNSDHVLPIEYDQVKVARRVFRSGESEYLINGTNCRLKDIQELFFDTGIGKDGYSIIGQGQIDKILSGKPEDRRELFDEAAGIVKYKKRKATAEKNLEEERLNLSRVRDILSEIEKQVEPLKKQSDTAREYLSYRDTLRTNEVNMFILDYDRIHDTTKEVASKLTIATSDLENVTKEYESTKEEYSKLEQDLEQRNSHIDELKSNLSDGKVNIEKLDGEIKVLNEQLASFNLNNTHYTERINSYEEDLSSRQEELKNAEDELKETEEALKENISIRNDITSNFSNLSAQVQEYSDATEEVQNEIYELMNQKSECKTKIERVETLLEQVNINKVELTQKLLEQKTIEHAIQEEIDEYQSELDKVNEKINNLNSDNQSFKTELNNIQTQIDENTRVLNDKQHNLMKNNSKLENLRNMTERYEGYGNSIKRVMEQKDKEKGIKGVVADIIKVDSKYEQAIETALGGSIQNIVTDNENTAKVLIQFLKVNKYGRATFLPLTAVKARGEFSYNNALNENGVIGIASDLIATDSEFTSLIKSLVGKVLVVDNIDNAISIAKKYNNSFKIVTLEGDLMNPGGSMSGGAFRNSSNLLSRRRELDDIEKEINKLGAEVNSIKSKLQELNSSRDKIQKQVLDNNNKLQQLSIEQNTAMINWKQVNSKFEEKKEFYKKISLENADIQNKESDLNNEIEKLNNKLVEIEKLVDEKEQFITETNEKLNSSRENERDYTSKMSDVAIKISSLDQKKRFTITSIERIKEDIAKITESKLDLEGKLDNAESDMESKEKEITDNNERILKLKESVETLEAEIAKAVEERDDITSKHKTFFTKREELSNQMNSLDKEIFRLNNQKEKLDEQLEGYVNYMWEEYELTYGTAQNYKTEEELNYSALKKSIAELKTKIKNLGDVNVNAIEDYKILVERYDLLKTQHDDLVESEKSLLTIIEELDVEMRNQFEEKFEYIKSQFDVVFRELFGGGKGTIEIEEDADILDAGIRIIAQPPGKKLQNMMQLSGGEKALTAIALLFAIQNLKPSPFCLLDEIEAALDDANVKRYAEYLNKLTEHTQFIVITHRRGTMNAADILYGITMQEKGVSTLVSVSLIEDKLDK
ncbi:MAG: chromosome segregation protein SMC [Lachnospiraceae bacterium]|nr:chromosome segregation protein SMC [Lachnospiraceae bacterium]